MHRKAVCGTPDGLLGRLDSPLPDLATKLYPASWGAGGTYHLDLKLLGGIAYVEPHAKCTETGLQTCIGPKRPNCSISTGRSELKKCERRALIGAAIPKRYYTP
jgi:hypothetical protein